MTSKNIEPTVVKIHGLKDLTCFQTESCSGNLFFLELCQQVLLRTSSYQANLTQSASYIPHPQSFRSEYLSLRIDDHQKTHFVLTC